MTADPRLAALLAEVRGYPSPDATSLPVPGGDVLLPLQLDHDAGVLSFHSTMTTFGAPHDVTLAELAMEAFLPADAATREVLRHLAATRAAATTGSPR